MTDLIPADGAKRVLLTGTFSLWADGKGGLVIVTEIEGRGVEKHPIPAGVIRMMSRPPFSQILDRMFGGAKPPQGAVP